MPTDRVVKVSRAKVYRTDAMARCDNHTAVDGTPVSLYFSQRHTECPRCGRPTVLECPVADTGTVFRPPSNGLIDCKACGFRNPNNYIFCGSCGTRLPSNPDPAPEVGK